MENTELQEFGQENKLLVRLKTSTTIEEKVADRVVAVFKKEFSSNQFVIDSSTEIGPTIGQKLQEDALIAIVISFAGIILYVAARFELRFGIAAALATFHDVLAVLGAFYILDKEITLLVVTALLTLAGYSLTDTVVVFDRIRENLRMRRRESEETIINNAVNQVLSRTIVTTLTVVLVLIPLTRSRWRGLARLLSGPVVGRDFWDLFVCLRRESVAGALAWRVRTAVEAELA